MHGPGEAVRSPEHVFVLHSAKVQRAATVYAVRRRVVAERQRVHNPAEALADAADKIRNFLHRSVVQYLLLETDQRRVQLPRRCPEVPVV